MIAKGQSFSEFRQAVVMIKDKYLAFHEGKESYEEPDELRVFKLKHPSWICQPYVRPPPEEHLKKMEEIKERQSKDPKRKPEEQNGGLSKRKMKKIERNPNKTFSKARENCKLCLTCPNPCGTKCGQQLCRQCCRTKCFEQELDCEGHKIWVFTKRQTARKFAREQQQSEIELK